MISQTGIWSTIEKQFSVSDQDLVRALKCTPYRLKKLKSGDAEMTTDDVMRLCHSLGISGDKMADILFHEKV